MRKFFVLAFGVVFVATGFAVATTSNPVLDFVGYQSGVSVEELQHQQQRLNQQNQGEEIGLVGRFVGFLKKFVSNFIPGAAKTTQSQIEATLKCLPQDVLEGEPILLLWQCKSAVEVTPKLVVRLADGNTQEIDFSDTTIGSYVFDSVFAVDSVELYCRNSNKPSQTCDINTINANLTLSADKTEVSTGDTVKITWSAEGVRNCKLTSDDEDQKSWVKYGTKGEVYSHEITKDTTFTLECETPGLPAKKSITITVK